MDLTVAYIGFGYSVKRFHLPYVERRKDHIHVKYIYRRKEDVEKEGTQDEQWYPYATFTTEIDQVMNDPEVNLVVVNTPDDFHVPYAMMALEHGKNVLCEKPFATTAEEAKKVFAYARSKGLVAMANQNRRFDADARTVKKVLESGKLGELVELESHYDYYRPQMASWNKIMFLKGLVVHPLDQVIGMLGIPQRVAYDVRSIDTPGEADNYVDLDLFYPNGLKAIVKTSIYVKLPYPRFIVHGKKGSLTIPFLGHQSGEKQKEGPVEISFEPLGEEAWGTLSYIDDDGNDVTEKVPLEIQDYGLLYDNIIDVLQHQAEKIVKDEEVVEVLRIIEKGERIAKEVTA